MKNRLKFTLNILIWALMLFTAYAVTTPAQTSTTANQPTGKKASTGQIFGVNPAVTGTGTTGQIPKWSSFNGIEDSIITETKLGNIGIGTTTPGSKLTVQGMIETTLGGYKFPDGTVQTSALTASQVVTSVNGLKGNVSLAAGANITITLSGSTLTFAAPKLLSVVAHDETLTGDGAATPLGVTFPLAVFKPSQNSLLSMSNAAPGRPGVFGSGGPGNDSVHDGGIGVVGGGGDGNTGIGGEGVSGFGGVGFDHNGGPGGHFFGGLSHNGTGGDGAIFLGGLALGTGRRGGNGLTATAGQGDLGATPGLAGRFVGDVSISGNLSKGGGSFKIDHPLDPENRYLYHSFVESPDMMNIYNGTITTDGNGDATVALPDWFEALNQDFRYQLTVIGTFAQAIVAQKVKGNRFVVKTNLPNVEVSWQVTGIRHDAYANKHRIPVEEQKPDDERGLFLHPDAFNQPEDRGVQFVKIAPQIERLNAMREQMKQQSPQQ